MPTAPPDSTIEVISFDLDDTLWSLSPVLTQANQTLYAWLGAQAPAFTERYQLSDFDKLKAQVLCIYPERAHSVTAIRLAVLEQGLKEVGYRGQELERLTKEAFDCFLKARNRVQFFQHSLAMLDDLSRDFRLGALSNGNADIKLVGLERHFDFCFNADRVGTAKPDPLMFQEMLKHTGTQPEQVIHIGDSPEHDIQGAHNAGIHSLWVNLEGRSWDAGDIQPPTLEARCLSEIPTLIRRFSNTR